MSAHVNSAPGIPASELRSRVRRAAVLGSGTMGAQIAALLASHGIACDLLDLPSEGGHRNRLAEEAKRRLAAMRLSPLHTPDALSIVTPGNFADDLGRLREADWVIEAVVESLDVKREVWSTVAPYLRPTAFASTNTSSIPIASIADALPPPLRRRFMGTHFFNPPRYMHLLELVPTAETGGETVGFLARFAEHVLGKGVVFAKDVPGFIGNRLGAYGLLATIRAMLEHGLGPDEVDGITGPAMARPASATFRTLDIVGLDVFADLSGNIQAMLRDPDGQAAFEVPPQVHEMVRRGWTGEKEGQGFYKQIEQNGQTQVLALDLATMEYRPRRRPQAPSLAAVRDVEDGGERLRVLVGAGDAAGAFAWAVLSRMLCYAAGRVGEVADDLASIDQAMRWGFNWELGPFQIWDELGVGRVADRMEGDGLIVPAWVKDLATRGGSFYAHHYGGMVQASPDGAYRPVPEMARSIPLPRLKASGKKVLERSGATLYDLDDGVAYLGFHSPRQAIGPEVLDTLEELSGGLPAGFRGMVISSHVQPNFCVGANLALMLSFAESGSWDRLDVFIRRFQWALLGMKRLSWPLVIAPYGRTLGGGVELVLAGHRVVAAAESYLGLVETGAGLIPAAGGCKEMLLRALEGLPGGMAGLLDRSGGGAPSLAPTVDPNTVLGQVFELIGRATVSGHAWEARSFGFVRPSDRIVVNQAHLLYEAKGAVMTLDDEGFTPAQPARIPVLGADSRALLELMAHHQVWSGQASEHDLKIARKLAYVLTGGAGASGSVASEEHFLDLEREAFLSLFGEPKTQARVRYVLDTGRRLRN